MRVKLEDVCEKGSSNIKQSDVENSNGDYPVFGASGYLGNVNFYHQDKPYVAVVKDGAGIGRTTMHPANSSVIGTMQYLLPKENILPEYLYYVVSYMNLSKYYSGATIPHIYFKDYKNEKFSLDCLDKQRQIVMTLDKVQSIIDKRKKQLKKLDELVKSRFIEMFGDPNSNEKGWTVSTLGEYMTLLTDFSANGSYELLDSNVVMYDEPNYAVMVRTTDLEAGNLTDGVKYIDRTAYELLSKSKLYGGELIMNKIGSAGKIYIMPQIDKPASLGRNAFMFRFDDRINMVYLYALLSSDYGTKEIQQYVRGAVTKTITKESTRSIRVIVPPIELQSQFAAFVKQVDKSKFEIKQSLEKLELLKKALMQKYFG